MGSQCAGRGADRAEQGKVHPGKDRVGWGEGKEGAGEDERGKGREREGEGERKRRDRGRRRGALPPEVGRSEDKPQHLPEGHSPLHPGGPVRAREGALETDLCSGQCLRGPRDGDPATPPAPVPARAAGAPGGPGPRSRACRRRSGPAARGSACAGPRRPAPGRAGQIAARDPPAGQGRPCGSASPPRGPSGARGPLQGSHSAGHCGREARALPRTPRPISHARGWTQRLVPGDRAGGDGSLRVRNGRERGARRRGALAFSSVLSLSGRQEVRRRSPCGEADPARPPSAEPFPGRAASCSVLCSLSHGDSSWAEPHRPLQSLRRKRLPCGRSTPA